MRIIAHRGATGYATENTLTAFGMAVEMGADIIETDVRLSADGVPMLFHDETLQRLAGSPQAVGDLAEEELRDVKLPGGEKIPSLREALAALGGAVPFVLEMKEPAAVSPALQVIKEMSLTRSVSLVSFHAETVRAARKGCPELKRGLITLPRGKGRRLRYTWPTLTCLALGADLLVVHHGTFRDSMTRLMRPLRKKIYLWAGCDEERELGVERIYGPLLRCRADGLATIYPDRLRELLG